MYSLSDRPPDVRSTPNSGPIADILRSRRWANTDREFTFADYHPDGDYHPDEPGASQGGRALFVDNFDGPAQPKAAISSKDIAPNILSSDGGWILLYTVCSTVPGQFIPKVSSE
jgi:hypothetical protein